MKRGQEARNEVTAQLLESYSKQINGPLNVYSKGGCIVMTSSRAFQLLFTINSLTLI